MAPADYRVEVGTRSSCCVLEPCRDRFAIAVPIGSSALVETSHRSCRQHDLVVVPAGSIATLRFKGHATLVSIEVSPTFAAHAFGRAYEPREVEIVNDEIVSLFARELALAWNESSVDEITRRCMAVVAAGRVGAALSARAVRGELSSQELETVVAHVDARLDGQFVLEELADVVKMAPRSFSRSFRRATGLAPRAWVAERKLRRAEELLREGTLPVTQVALEVGLSTSHLSRSFAKHFGVSPKMRRMSARS